MKGRNGTGENLMLRLKNFPNFTCLAVLTLTPYRLRSNIVTFIPRSYILCLRSWFTIYQTYWSLSILASCNKKDRWKVVYMAAHTGHFSESLRFEVV